MKKFSVLRANTKDTFFDFMQFYYPKSQWIKKYYVHLRVITPEIH